MIVRSDIRHQLPPHAFIVRALILVGLLLLGHSVSRAEIITVPGDYPTIQQAINAAADGDEIVVSPGTYYENVDFTGRNITLRSTDPLDPTVVDSTIIDGRSLDSVVIMDGGTVSGFTIVNGDARSWGGGGVRVRGGPTEVSHNVIKDCRATTINELGGGVRATRSTVVVRDNVISDNWAWAGGGVSMGGGTVINNVITNNAVFYGIVGAAGGGVVAGGGAIVRNNVISGNYSDGWAGGAWVDGDAVFEGNIIANNWAQDEGGGVVALRVTTIRNNTLIGNATPDFAEAGGIYAGGSTTVINNIIAYSEGGAAVYIGTAGDPDPYVDYNCLFGNLDGDWGGDGVPGENNILEDPLFVDAPGPDGIPGTEDDNLRVLPDSPVIDAGDPDYVPAEGETELDGHARVLCDRVDMGAYEFGIGDYDCDRVVDLFDFAEWQACMTGPNNPPDSPLGKGGHRGVAEGCEAFDFDGDLDVDFTDFGGFQAAVLVP